MIVFRGFGGTDRIEARLVSIVAPPREEVVVQALGRADQHFRTRRGTEIQVEVVCPDGLYTAINNQLQRQLEITANYRFEMELPNIRATYYGCFITDVECHEHWAEARPRTVTMTVCFNEAHTTVGANDLEPWWSPAGLNRAVNRHDGDGRRQENDWQVHPYGFNDIDDK